MAIGIAVTGLLASEHHGTVRSGGLPIPGATVTAIQADKKVVTTTDEQGAYLFPNLADQRSVAAVDERRLRQLDDAPRVVRRHWRWRLRAGGGRRVEGGG